VGGLKIIRPPAAVGNSRVSFSNPALTSVLIRAFKKGGGNKRKREGR
jgi:hypothetical protein